MIGVFQNDPFIKRENPKIRNLTKCATFHPFPSTYRVRPLSFDQIQYIFPLFAMTAQDSKSRNNHGAHGEHFVDKFPNRTRAVVNIPAPNQKKKNQR